MLDVSEGRRESGATTSAGWTLAVEELDLAWHSLNKTIQMMLREFLEINRFLSPPLAGVQRPLPLHPPLL